MLNFTKLSRFYHNLATLDQAGLTFLKAFEGFKRTEKDPDQIYKIQFMITHIEKNRPLSDGFKFIKYVPAFDIPLIKAAEGSGRLVEVFKTLSKKYSDAVQAEKEIRGQLIQPFITFVVALFVPSFPDLFTNKISLALYLRNSLGILILVLFGIFALYRSWMKSFYDLALANKLFSFFSILPFFGGLVRKISMHRFVSGLAMMLDSGMELFESLKQASQFSGDVNLVKATDQFIPKIKQGMNPVKALDSLRYFPEEFVNAFGLGNDSGKLPEFLRNYSQQLQEDIDAKMKIITKILPLVIYFIVTIYVGSVILKFYTGHLNEVMDVIKDV